MLSVQIRKQLKGYNSHATQLGNQKKEAVPLSEGEMQLLLWDTAGTCNSIEQLLLLRDGMLSSLL